MRTISECQERITFLKTRIKRYTEDIERAKKNPAISLKAVMMVESMVERDKKELFQTEELIKAMQKKGSK